MRKLFFILFFLSFTTTAKVYDLSDPTVSLCNGSLTGNVYRCVGALILQKNDSVIVSNVDLMDVELISNGSAKLDSNKIGTNEQPIHINSLGGEVIIEGNGNEIYGFIIAQRNIKLKNVKVVGSIISAGGEVIIEGSNNEIDGNIQAQSNIKLKKIKVIGNVISHGDDIIIEENNNEIDGNIQALRNVKLKNTKVFGDVTSEGGEVIIEENNNQVIGNIMAHSNAKLKEVLVCGTITSIGGSVSVENDNNKIYAKIDAINSFGKVTLKNSEVCGVVSSQANIYDYLNTTLYCGIDSTTCIDKPACPISSSDDICNASPPSENYILTITPKEKYSLVCNDVEFNVLVMTDSGTPTPVIGKRITLQFDESKLTLLSSDLITDNNGEVTLLFSKLNKEKIEDIVVKASLQSDSNVTDEGEVHYVPYMFETSATKVIANQSHFFDIVVLACGNDEIDIVKNYKGTKRLDVSSYKLIQPTESDGIRTDFELSGQTNPSKIELIFDEGKASTSLMYQEAGAIHFTLSDPNFICPPNFDCNDYPVDSDLLSTTVNVESRPWKLVICSDIAVDGDSSGGSALVAAGERFSVKVKPVRFGTATDLCQLPVTQNFFKSSAPFSSISPSYELSTPTNGVKGTLAPLVPINNDVYVGVGRDSYYEFNNMTYSEVGSILFKSEALSPIFYDGILGGIEFGDLSIGRFYPAYFTITDTLWDHPEKQGSSEGTYTYMAQPFDDVNFAVTAYSESDTTVNNYGLFDTSIKASFSLTGDYNERLNIASSDLDNTHWSNATWETPDLSKGVIWSRKSASTLAGNITTTADGPFNDGVNAITTALNLAISGVDPVSFDKTQEVLEQELLSQPKVRYGRMVLDSVGTSAGQSVIVPLRVEFWNGGRFVVNDTDSKSSFDGEKHEKQTIWPDPTKQSSSKLVGRGVIVNGNDSISLIAEPDSRILREQVRFWLCLDPLSSIGGGSNVNCQGVSGSNEEQPWLQYNWRGQGDEDPSTVVTFGIYRGNDRILFRGESNIIGTSN
ncbi:DUF6701 domain-containing protein [Aliivibrio sp. 1S128]|uniref:DUF6701 domain-containing protein n=1 Tax=Aliivibrio sp. 1S128 TaxID=1840085 RepID=UPI00080DEFA4|nr:DUF6701 domain-containing protein [Aliivibrio sp. 1S128]OCH25207.1 hypothetical protein A6E03_05475 [Aliivibrio sp. 1S128]